MGKNETYWNGLEQYQTGPMFEQGQKHEFSEELPLGETFSEESMGYLSNRRDFLKLFGFGLTAAAITACVDKPVNKAIPYVVKPENVTPGVASWYATTCQGCSANCGLLVKSREGRPIKVEGNDLHGMSKGGTCAVGQATVLNLYDSERQKAPRGGKETSIGGAVTALKTQLDGVKAANGLVYVVSNTITSPTSNKVIKDFLGGFSNAKHVVYDSNSVSALATVHGGGSLAGGGSHWIPNFQFSKADVVLSIDADFMGNWISPIQFTKDYMVKRKVSESNPSMSRHLHFESRLSLTGSNADFRIPMKPSQLYGAVSMLYGAVTGNTTDGYDGPGHAVTEAAKELKAAGAGNALVVCGINDVAVQTLVKAINEALGSYGSTIDVTNPSNQAQGNDAALMEFHKNVSSAAAVIFLDEANPVYDTAGGAKLGEALAKMPLTISFNSKENETSEKCKFVIPQTHYLEAWDDAEPIKGHFSIQQPLVRPIFGSVQWQDALLQWSGSGQAYYDYLRSNWETSMFPRSGSSLGFRKYWEGIVRDGYTTLNSGAPEPTMVDGPKPAPAKPGAEVESIEPVPAPVVGDVGSAASVVVAAFKKGATGMELVVYEANYMRNGRYANNPWLQEMPDPITKVTWDNYVSIPYTYAMAQKIKDGDKLTVTVGANSVVLPAIVQPGLANDSVAIALGWGRADIVGRVSKGVGANAAKFIAANGDTYVQHSAGVTVAPTGENTEMAKTQTYIGYELIAEAGTDKLHSIEGRISDYILKETTLEKYKENRADGNKRPSPHHMLSLWDIHDKKGHHWAMAIDLNACTGCGNCIVSCNAENNIAMVGRDEVRRRREMHWMRIDRYFRGAPDAQDHTLQMMNQPMLCQHCDNAPCESVCPVLATTHSDEGLNQQIYNRCIGTRYCANNCPYKVRRFNWFSYYWNDKFKDVNPMQHDKIGRWVLNPDVTVRARGVMEKCSMCVQRIQEKKLLAKTEMRNPRDGEIKTACQQSCPADAIVFGDLNDKDSEVRKLYGNKRGYHALEDVKTLPKVLYLTKVRNNHTGIEKHGESGAAAESTGDHA